MRAEQEVMTEPPEAALERERRVETSAKEDSSAPPADRPPSPAAEDAPEGELRSLRRTNSALLVIAALFTLYYARSLVLPIVLAVFLSFLFSPVVRFLHRYRVPSSLSAGFILVVFVAAAATAALQLAQPAQRWLEEAPQHLRVIEEKLRFVRKPLENITEAGATVEKATKLEGADSAVEVTLKGPPLTDSLLTLTGSFAASLLVTLVLLYFFLSSGRAFVEKIVESVPRLREKVRVLQIARSVEVGISSYLCSVTVINLVLGAVIAAAMWFLSMPNPLLWGAMAAAFNFVPYLGAAAGTVVVAVVALVTFESPGQAAVVPIVYWTLTALEGNVITPIVLGLRLDLSPPVVFLSLLFWGWLWGVPGVFLAVPILAAMKIFCDYTKSLEPLGRFLVR